LVSCVRTQAACSDGASSWTRYAWRWLADPGRQAKPLELACEAAAAQRRLVRADVDDDRLIAPLLPRLEQRWGNRRVAQEHVAEEVGLGRGHGEAVGAERGRLAQAERADQQLMPDQALQEALRPAEEVRARMHA
jgi:hypothetical protein